MAKDVDVLTETVIRRPCAVVAAYAGDPTNAPEWYANIDSVEWRTEPPVAVGSRMDFVARFLGRLLAYTDHRDPRTWTTRSAVWNSTTPGWWHVNGRSIRVLIPSMRRWWRSKSGPVRSIASRPGPRSSFPPDGLRKIFDFCDVELASCRAGCL